MKVPGGGRNFKAMGLFFVKSDYFSSRKAKIESLTQPRVQKRRLLELELT